MSTKRKPTLLSSSTYSRKRDPLPEPPVKEAEDSEVEESNVEDSEDDAEPERVVVRPAKKAKPSAAPADTIPSAQELQRIRQEAFERERKIFRQELIQNFERNVRNESSSFVVCYDMRYKWHHACLEELFKPKGYEVVYKNVRDYDEDRTFAELRIPGLTDAREPFHI